MINRCRDETGLAHPFEIRWRGHDASRDIVRAANLQINGQREVCAETRGDIAVCTLISPSLLPLLQHETTATAAVISRLCPGERLPELSMCHACRCARSWRSNAASEQVTRDQVMLDKGASRRRYLKEM